MLYSRHKLADLFHLRFPDTHFLFFPELPSTNAYLREHAKQCMPSAFCMTSMQTAGYGQRLRKWESTSATLTFSLLMRINQPLAALEGFTPLIGLKLIEALCNYSDDTFSIKWPNDIYMGGKKVAGILVETALCKETYTDLVVGIGINLDSPYEVIQNEQSVLADKVNAGFVRLRSDITDNIEQLLADIVDRLLDLGQNFVPGLFESYALNYRLVDYFKEHETVIVYDNGHHQTAYYIGLSKAGALQLLVENELVEYCTGAVSIRKYNELI
ncbi:biotin--[acetyl-CoA-carboxylase] ligase [Thiomicrorhabdus cannonii]|uniref:biotin--[acetyl-CoA-carboxylase] ligase n=1 Tax=Thiomicrorhabdus cannonii TaxID=2748011 RepID=UPI0015BFF54D|nr:biotin--[acetyl-CoA-carboxylase] ligase [Thiomicrorhabdus cannonii]